MSWTYDATKLQDGGRGTFDGSTIGLRYQIRLLVQDVNTNRQLMQDEEIDWFQTQEMNAYMAASKVCFSLIARYGNVQSKRVGDLGLTYSPKYYEDLGYRLQARGLTYQMPYVGGTSITDKLAEQANVDAVVPRFFVGFGDNPFASQPGPGEQVSEAINNPNAI